MHLDNYTSLNGVSLNTSISKHFEQILLTIVACLGLLGSVYIFADNTLLATNPPESNFQLFCATPADTNESTSSDFDKYVKIEGDYKVDSELRFQFLGDPKASRYVMEMGDEMRHIITTNNFTHAYSKSGKYTIELKEIKRGLITVLASKEIKIK